MSRFRTCCLIGATLLLGVYASVPASSQTIIVGLDSAHLRSTFKSKFYGVNGQERNSLPWDQTIPNANPPTYFNPGFPPALQGLNLGVLRFPTGTGANYWDWNQGDFLLNYDDGHTAASLYTSPLSELKNELASASPAGNTTALFILNMLTDPMCVPAPPGPPTSYCTPSPSSPNEAYQLQMLQEAKNIGLNIPQIELGNEFYLPQACYMDVYPTVQDYVNAANQWINDIRSQSGYSKVKLAAVGAHVVHHDARQTDGTRVY